jgi:translocation and assembly module TamB
MVRKITAGTLIALLVLAAIPAALLWFLAYTPEGIRFVVDRVPTRIGPVTLHIEGASGTVAGGFTVQRFTLEHELVSLRVEGIRMRLRVLPLLWQRLEPLDAVIDDALVVIHPRRTAPPNRPMFFLPGFLTIYAKDAYIRRATLVPLNGMHLDFTNLRAESVLHAKTIRFFSATGHLGDLAIDANGLLTAASPMKMQASARLVFAPQGLPRWVARGDLDGDLNAAPLSGQLLEPFRADVRTGVLRSLGNWGLEGDATIHDFDLRAFGGGGVLGLVKGQQHLLIDRDGWHARGTLDPAGIGAGVFDTEFEGSYSQRYVTARRIVVTHRASRATATAAGRIGVVPHGPELDLTGRWSRFRWPLDSATPAAESAEGEFRLAGTWPYAVEGRGTIAAGGLAPMPVELRGHLDRDRLEIASVLVQAFNGSGEFSGDVEWQPKPRWSLAGPVHKFDPATLRPDVPGSLDFEVAAMGNAFSSSGDLSIAIRNLTGTLRGAPARASGGFARRGGTWQFDKVDLAAVGLRATLDGHYAETGSNVAFRLEARDLGLLLKGAKGSLKADGRFAGTLAQPSVDADASGRNLEYGDLAAASLDAQVDFDAQPKHASNVSVTARDLTALGRDVKTLHFTLLGETGRHEVQLEAQAEDVTVRAHAAGGYADGTWSGTLGTLDVAGGSNLKLTLDAPVKLRAARAGGEVQKLCLRDDAARFCGDAQWSDAQWQANVDASKLPLSTLTAGLTPRVVYDGIIDFNGHAGAAGPAPVTGALHADLRDARLRHKRSNGREDLVPLGTGSVVLQLDPAMLSARVLLDAGETGRIDGNLAAQRSGADWRDMPLRAELRANSNALGFVNLYVPEIDRAAGTIETDLTAGGTLGAPLFAGKLNLKGGELDLYQINLALRAVAVQASVADSVLDFQGAAQAGEGSVAAAGKLSWKSGKPVGRLTLKGENLLLTNVPEARITASPDLAFTINGRALDASGTVTVPFARITPADLTGAVLTSSDEVLVGTEPRKPEETFSVSSNIRLVLGERVNIDTFGLSGKLTGSIVAQTTPDGVSRGTGELNVAEGKYAALGRRLDIERGRLIFGGGLLADPGIDIRAYKEFPDVKAGVNVRGTLRTPRMTFYSEPSLPQSQIVSLILAGGSLESAQDSEKAGAGRNALLAQGGAILAQQIGQRVGIEDVSIEQNLANETSLVLGRYLSPRLYVSYGISLAEAINTVKMRYALNDRWTIKTEAGKDRSADVVFTIER